MSDPILKSCAAEITPSRFEFNLTTIVLLILIRTRILFWAATSSFRWINFDTKSLCWFKSELAFNNVSKSVKSPYAKKLYKSSSLGSYSFSRNLMKSIFLFSFKSDNFSSLNCWSPIYWIESNFYFTSKPN